MQALVYIIYALMLIFRLKNIHYNINFFRSFNIKRLNFQVKFSVHVYEIKYQQTETRTHLTSKVHEISKL